MKRKILAICFILLLCSCGTAKEEGTITPIEMKEDYEIMWTMIEENVPVLPALKINHNKDYLKIKETYQNQLPDKTVTLQEYYDFLTKCLDEFKDSNGLPFAHISTLNYSNLQNYRSDATPFSDQTLDVNKNKNLKLTYEKFLNFSASPPYQSFNILSYNDNSLLYIKGNHADSQYTEKNKLLLSSYLDEFSTFDSIIIDYRNNTGGDDIYWQNVFIDPLTSGPLKVFSIFKISNNKTSSEFIKNFNFPSESKYTCSELEFENCSDDIFYKLEGEYISTEAPYEGKDKISNIILLTGPITFSSATNFTDFSKISGFATVVGESSSDSRGITPMVFALKNSGIAIRMTAVASLNKDGSLIENTGTTPDIEYSFKASPNDFLDEEEAIEILNIVKANKIIK